MFSLISVNKHSKSSVEKSIVKACIKGESKSSVGKKTLIPALKNYLCLLMQSLSK